MAFEAAAGMLDRLVPVASAVRRIARTLAALGAAAAALIAWALFHGGLPEKDDELVGRIVLLAVAAAPAAILFALWLALGELLELPERVRRLPERARTQAGDLQSALREVDEGRTRRRGRLRALWRLGRVHGAAAETLRFYAPLTAFLSVPFLVASMLSALAVPLELVIALVAVVAM